MKTRKLKLSQLVGVALIAVFASACGDDGGGAVNPPPPATGGVGNPFNFGYCPPGMQWQCGWGNFTNGQVFATGVGYYYGDVFELRPGQVPSPYDYNVGFNGHVRVQAGNQLRLSGTATWGEMDLEWWETIVTGWWTDYEDYCEPRADAQVVIGYENQPAFPIDPGQSVVVNVPGQSGVFYGYDPASRPPGSDCLILINLRLDRI